MEGCPRAAMCADAGLPSSGVQQEHSPDGFRGSAKGSAARSRATHTRRASDTHLITHSRSCCHLPGEKKGFVIEVLLWRGETLALFRHVAANLCGGIRIRSQKVKGRARAQLRPSVTLETLRSHFQPSRFGSIDAFFFFSR